MKPSLNRTGALLSSGPAETKAEAYQTAWGLLLNHVPHVTEVERARARCWLSYRTFEGEVPFADWLAQIEPVRPNAALIETGERARWEVSVLAADTFVLLAHGAAGAWQGMARQALVRCECGGLDEWPPTLLTAQRLLALLAYEAWLDGRDAEAVTFCQRGWEVTQCGVAAGHWVKFPWHFQHELWPLHVLTWVAVKCGACQPEEGCVWGGVRDLTMKGVSQVPLLGALALLSARAPRRERVLFPAPKPSGKLLEAKLSERQQWLWQQVKAAGVTHVPVATGQINLGDDIQSLAALHWCGLEPEAWCQRDDVMNWPAGGRVLLCGWYNGPFLPPESYGVEVVVCGFHLNPRHEEAMVKAGLFERLAEMVSKQGFPAGARDTATMELLQRHGIEAEWSGCPSQLLPRYEGARAGGLAVDAEPPGPGWVQRTHRVAELAAMPVADRLRRAGEQIERLQSCERLITTRLHAALPALAMGCPEVRVVVGKATPNPGRWTGFIDQLTN